MVVIIGVLIRISIFAAKLNSATEIQCGVYLHGSESISGGKTMSLRRDLKDFHPASIKRKAKEGWIKMGIRMRNDA